MENVRLNNGITAPILGFGTYQISPSQTKAAVAEALKLSTPPSTTATKPGSGRRLKKAAFPAKGYSSPLRR